MLREMVRRFIGHWPTSVWLTGFDRRHLPSVTPATALRSMRARSVATRLTVRAPGDYEGKPGTPVALRFDPTRLHRFDSQGKVLV